MSGGLFTLGEALFRLSVPVGDRLDDAASLSVHEGGAEANVAVAVARMGHPATWCSRLPDTPLGQRIVAGVARQGVDTSAVVMVPDGRVGIYYFDPPASPRSGRVIYDRQGSTVCALTLRDVPWERVESAAVVHLTGITPALSESLAEATHEIARRARGAGAFVTFDVNHRSQLWSLEKARPTIVALGRESNLCIIGQDDAQALFGVADDSATAVAELRGVFANDSIVLTLGDQGCVWSIEGRSGEFAALPARLVDPIGAGDAFAAGIVVGVLEGNIEHGIQLGTAMAALTLGWNGDRFWGDRDLVIRTLKDPARDLVR